MSGSAVLLVRTTWRLETATVRRSSAVLFAARLRFVGFKEGGALACRTRTDLTSEEAGQLQKKEGTEKLGGAQQANPRASCWGSGRELQHRGFGFNWLKS